MVKGKDGCNGTAKSVKDNNAWRKEKLQVLGNCRNGHHQTNRDGIKRKEYSRRTK